MRLFAALFAVTLLAYQPVWHGAPLWDDDAHMTREELRSVDGLRRIWVEPEATQQYYPLVHTSFWLMHRLWGDATPGYHVVNIALHAVSALVVALLLRRLAVPGAVFAAFLFALHPVQVESVAWITELKNTQSTALYLLAALAYLKFDDTRSGRDWALAATLFVAALLSKTVTATLPVSLLVVLWWRRGTVSVGRDVAPLVPFFALALAAGLTTVWVEHTLIGARGAEFDLTPIERGLVAGRAVWFYVTSLVWPVGLTFVYPRWSVDQSVWWQYAFPVALSVLLGATWVIRRRTRAPLTTILLYCVALAPALGFVNVYPFVFSFVADHFQYLATVPASAALASASMAWIAPRLGAGVRLPAAVGATCVLGVLTWQLSHQYADAETLYQTTIARNPGAWLAHQNLGAMKLGGAGADLEAAIAHTREAIRLYPDNAETHNNLGFALRRLGRVVEARREFELAVSLNPRLVTALNNLAALDDSEGRIEEAARGFREVLRLDPDNVDAERNLGLVLLRLGRPAEAAPLIERAAGRRPDDPNLRRLFGFVQEDLGRLDLAIVEYREAVRLAPGFAAAHASLARALLTAGRIQEALAAFAAALALPPNAASADLHNAHGVALAQAGRRTEALAEFREALRLDPNFTDARTNLERIR